MAWLGEEEGERGTAVFSRLTQENDRSPKAPRCLSRWKRWKEYTYRSFFRGGGGKRVGTETVETDRENIGRESVLSGWSAFLTTLFSYRVYRRQNGAIYPYLWNPLRLNYSFVAKGLYACYVKSQFFFYKLLKKWSYESFILVILFYVFWKIWFRWNYYSIFI